jgi:flavin reductase (DIM6/NTAB) family NADH-FMN oxidoreductase RutF
MTPIGMRNLRNVLGCYATGIAVMTTRTQAGEHVGVTVNSFASLSLDPPLILFRLPGRPALSPIFNRRKAFR